MEKYGFVYLWYDKKHKRFYVGSHWGTEDDGYICSSNWMNKSYKRRPKDFKRRILSKIYTNRKDLYAEETRFLHMIKEDEIKTRYYNLNIKGAAHWTATSYDNVCRKIKDTHWTKRSDVDEIKSKLSKSNKLAYENDSTLIERIAEANRGKILSKSHKDKMSTSMKEKWKDPVYSAKITGMRGKKHSDETKRKMRQNNAMKDSINVEKIKKAKEGIQYLTNGDKNAMAVPGSERWEKLIESGWKIGYTETRVYPKIIINGKAYKSSVDAAKALGISKPTINRRIRSNDYPNYRRI